MTTAASRPPLSRCPETEKLIDLIGPLASPQTATSPQSEPPSPAHQQLLQHCQDCPLCSVTLEKMTSGYGAFLPSQTETPQPLQLERIARGILPHIAKDLASPSRGPVMILVALVFLLMAVASFYLSRQAL